jgi:hypothetical protein
VLRLDHVVLATSDLDAAAARLLVEYGLDSAFGGEHPTGTANRIVPLGETYVELIAVNDPAVAESNPFGRAVLAFVPNGDGLFAWAVATDDIALTAKWIGSQPMQAARRRPDGVELQWRMAGIEGSMADRSLPFFIQWDIAPDEHPGRMPVQHRVDVRGITEVEIAGKATKVRNRINGEPLPIRVTKGEVPGPKSVTIATTDGEIVLI